MAGKHAQQQRRSEPRRSASLTTALHINMHRRQMPPAVRPIPASSDLRPMNAGSSDSEDGEERSANAWTVASALLTSSSSRSASSRNARSTPAPSSAPVSGRSAELRQCPQCHSWNQLTQFAHANAWICGHIDDLGKICGHTWTSNGLRGLVCTNKKHESVLERHWGVYGFACVKCEIFAPLNPMEKKKKKKMLQITEKKE